MERDFLGLCEQNSAAVVKKRPEGLLETDFSADSRVPCPFANKSSAKPKIISFKTMQDNKQKKVSFNPLSSTGLQHLPSDDLLSAHKRFISHAPQKYLGHGAMQFALHACPNRFMNNNLAFEEPFGSASTSKASLVNLTPRPNGQLTIFYAGSVNVYDNITSDAAKRILQMASKESNTAVKAVNSRYGASVLPLFNGLVSNGQNYLNNTNHVAYSRSGHSATVSSGAAISPSHNEPSKLINASMGLDDAKTAMSRAVPQARRASLSRFLERRKERLCNMMPYSYEKIALENSVSLEDDAPSSKCSSGDTSNPASPLLLSQTKSCSDSDASPSTKLEM